ncbi:MAG: trehalose-6-phosphate synthase [Dehalococcoidia bacterium]|nr:trehalose-6-phosphate synthase [Dehalococcoidia bacterium]
MADLAQLCIDITERYSLIVASNRGPVEYRSAENGELIPRHTSGGVVNAFGALPTGTDFTWVSSALGEADRRALGTDGMSKISHPMPQFSGGIRFVKPSRRVYHKYYNIICNPLLWFLHHYMWNTPYSPNIDSTVHDAWASGYRQVNESFVSEIVDEIDNSPKSPLVMLHDYHLYLCSGRLRDLRPDVVIQHYIHVPWPEARYWNLLPSEIITEILVSLCKSDVVGFQTSSDSRNFLATIELSDLAATIDWKDQSVTIDGHRCNVKVYPMGINTAEVMAISQSRRVLERQTSLLELSSEIAVVRIDRAEPSKNVVRSLKAYEILLRDHEELRTRVTFLAFIVPSRSHIRQYQRYVEEIHQEINRINTTYQTSGWTPVLAFVENNYLQAVAAMTFYDVLLVNTITEGTNLIALEGPIVNQRDGVTVLSTTSGVYPRLKEGVISVSPTDLQGTSEAIAQAIALSPPQKEAKQRLLRDVIERTSLANWLSDQFTDLLNI